MILKYKKIVEIRSIFYYNEIFYSTSNLYFINCVETKDIINKKIKGPLFEQKMENGDFDR